MKAVVAAFNQEKALVGAFSVITNLRMELFGALVTGVVAVVTLCLTPHPASSEDTGLQLVGDLSSLQHGVRGEVFTRGRRGLVLRNFFYDGGGPGKEEDNTVFFYAVNSSYPYRSASSYPYLLVLQKLPSEGS